MINPHWIPVHAGTLDGVPDREIFARWSPRFFKVIAIDNTIPYPESFPPGALIVVRNHPMSEMGNRNMAINALEEPLDQHYARWQNYQEDMNVSNAELRAFNDPIIAADYHVSIVRNMLNDAIKKGIDTRRLLFEGLNEPQLWAGEPPDWVAAYYRQFTLGCHALGTHVVVGNFGVGWPGNGGVQDAPVQWGFFKPVIDVMTPGDYLGLHEYWALNGPTENWKWWAGRYQQCPYNVPILITETGIDTGVNGVWYGGWYDLPGNTHDEKAKRYLNELYWYANTCAVDGRVKGIFPFSYDCESEWQKFNIRDVPWLNQLWPMLPKFKVLETVVPVIPPTDPGGEQIIVGVVVAEAPNDGTSYVYGNAWKSGVKIYYAWEGQPALAETVAGPHEGYPGWAEGYFNFPLYVNGSTPCQGSWEIWCQDGTLVSNRVKFHTDGMGGAVNQVEVRFTTKAVGSLTVDQLMQIEAERHDVLPINENAGLAQEGFRRGLWPTSDEYVVTNPTTGTSYTCQRFRKMGTNEVHVIYCVTGVWNKFYTTVYTK